MANKKTSEEIDGTEFKKDDLTRIARNGSNYKLTAEQVFCESITKADIDTKASNNELITGRYYNVTDYPFLGIGDNLFVATNESQYSTIGTSGTPGFGANNWNRLNILDNIGGEYNYSIDQFGNRIIYPQAFVTDSLSGQMIFPVNNQRFRGNTFYGLYDPGDVAYLNTSTQGVTFENSFTASYFQGSGIDTRINLSSNSFNASYIQFQGTSQAIYLNNNTFKNCTIVFEGDADITINNSSFENCTVYFQNGAYVDSLHVTGSINEYTNAFPTYYVDGSLNSAVVNSWAGIVVGDNENGYSTVKSIMTLDGSGNPNTWSSGDSWFFPVAQSVIGVYLIRQPDQDGTIGYVDPTQQNHPIKIEAFNDWDDSYSVTFDMATERNGSDPYRILQYHGKDNKVGEFRNNRDTITIYRAEEGTHPCWILKDGKHYDA